MSDSKKELEITSINELLDKQFFIPSYQRGYRWKNQQVEDLLNDVWEFFPQEVKDEKGQTKKDEKGKDKKTFYCLQPVVVKKRDDGKYEVIDGQQRLTTIFMIIHYANEMWIGKQKTPKFKIEYETRRAREGKKGSFEFLEDLKVEENNSVKIDDENIDYFHISKAYETIHEWVEKQSPFDNNDFQSKLRFHTKVIWYEIQEDENKIDAFTRLNMGKILLTSAELIKSLFLNSKNFKENEKNIKQIEIAKEWDEMEQTLQNDEFWYFLLTKEKLYSSRIELIFEIFHETREDKLTNEKKGHDGLDIYRYFQEQKEILELWSENENNIKKVFLTLKHWFEDRKLYHLIGFLISTGEKIEAIYIASKDKTKPDFEKFLYKKIKEKVKIDDIEDLEYRSNNKNIENILLLFNIATLLNEKSSHLRFAFDKFSRQKWSLEHIHPQSDNNIKNKQHWLEEAKEQIKLIPQSDEKDNQELLKQIEECQKELKEKKEETEQEFDTLKDKILDLFGAEPSDQIDNLTLLTEGDNSSLSNGLFPTKRKKVIDKDKNGSFIPICTKNVFLKYYSKSVQNFYFWSEEDRNDYLEAIKNTFNKFLNQKGDSHDTNK